METKHPKGLYFLFTVEMWERFGFYGMRAILTLYMYKALMFSQSQASTIYGIYLGLVYTLPLLGGYMADNVLGQRKSIYIGGFLFSAGYFLLAVQNKMVFFAALALIILGNGFFKPNISTMVGQMYKENDPRRDGGFTIFYMGINIGAFFSPLICGYLAEKISWGLGFVGAGIGMLIGMLTYAWGQKKYLGNIGIEPANKKIVSAAGETSKHAPLTREEKEKLFALGILMFFCMMFFAAYEQAGTSLTIFADIETNRTIFGWEMPASYFQVLNPLFIVMFAPLFSKLWINLAQKNKNPSAPFKFMWGMFVLGLGFVVMIFAAKLVGVQGKVNMMWLTMAYLFHTLGELCVSPVGLSTVTKLSPNRIVSRMMGFWFFATGLGGYFAGSFGSRYEVMAHDSFYALIAVVSIASALVLLGFSKKVRRLMHGVE